MSWRLRTSLLSSAMLLAQVAAAREANGARGLIAPASGEAVVSAQ